MDQLVGKKDFARFEAAVALLPDDIVPLQRGNAPGKYMKMTMAQIIAAASAGGGVTQVFVQDAEPTVEAGTAFIWVQTGLGDGTDFSVFAGVGQ